MLGRKSLVWLIVLLGFGLRVWLLDGQSLWWDEAKTVDRAFMSLPELFPDILSKRHHLPLYFLLTPALDGLDRRL